MKSGSQKLPVIAVGGVGGSGTRVVADVIRQVKFYIGEDLNQALDNLWFTLLFKRYDILEKELSEIKQLFNIFLCAQTGQKKTGYLLRSRLEQLSAGDRLGHPKNWLQQRTSTLLSRLAFNNLSPARWGWKEPNTHIVIEHLLSITNDIKYVHVMRHGLDMAFSNNLNQVKFWGSKLFGLSVSTITPCLALRYWCLVQQRLLNIRENHPDRIIILRYEDLCHSPIIKLVELMDFMEVNMSDHQLTTILSIIKTPTSIYRYKQYSLEQFETQDLAFVRQLGYDT